MSPRRRPDAYRAGLAIRTSGGPVLRENPMGNEWFYKASVLGGRFGDGRNPDAPNRDMADLFGRISSGDTIYVRGGVYANLTTPAGVTDVSIVGATSKPRHDHASDAQKMGSAAWRTASGVTDAPLLIVRSQGWRIANMLLAPPSAEAGVELFRDATYDASHFSLLGCRVAAGKYAITNRGGAGFVEIRDTRFEAQTTASIECLTTAIAVPLQWQILNSFFGFLSASHILSSASHWWVKGNTFAKVASTAKYIDLTHNTGQGLENVVTGNYLAGTYDTDDYVASGTDNWVGNDTTAVATTAPDGRTILRPAGP